MKKIIIFIILFCLAIGFWFLHSEIYSEVAQESEHITFTIDKGESISNLAERLEKEHVIRSAWLFKKYLTWKKIDRDVRQGTFEVDSPITLSRVVDSLSNPSVGEKTITILPGWNLRDIANYFEKENIASSTDFYNLVGKPAYNYKISKDSAPTINKDYKVLEDKPWFVSYEGYLSPDTFRIFKDASIDEVVNKLIEHRNSQFTDEMYSEIKKQDKSVFEIITIASLLEKEVRSKKDKAIVSDIFWRRYNMNWALQADSSVHYAVNKNGNVFTTKEDRESVSPWNTYKYPGLPLGPICNPSLDSIMAAIYPEHNNNWYFLTDKNGKVYYASTLEEHIKNKQKYLSN